MNITIEGWRLEHNAVELVYDAGGTRLTKRCTYDGDVVLTERWAAQLAMMEAIPLLGFAPEILNFGRASSYWTPRFAELWWRVWRGVGAQWRYERGLQNYEPRLGVRRQSRRFQSGGSATALPNSNALVFFGGGKDSLASITLLKRAKIDFSTFAYSHADYGAPEKQHALIGTLLDAARVEHRHRMRAEDDIDERASLICAETPISLFYALPLMLQHGYRYLVVGNERSADAPNLMWNGEAVNHQWGKSSEATRLLDEYLRAEWIANGAYFSILAPVHDAVIVSLLRDEPAVRYTHSCNVSKPWCEQCPKCAYVWLQLAAFLPREVVQSMFSEDLFAKNEATFRALLGIESHKPFECVGEPEEARLALELCRRRGIGGEVAERLARALPPIDVDALAAKYLAVYDDGRMPSEIRERVMPILTAATAASSLR